MFTTLAIAAALWLAGLRVPPPPPTANGPRTLPVGRPVPVDPKTGLPLTPPATGSAATTPDGCPPKR